MVFELRLSNPAGIRGQVFDRGRRTLRRSVKPLENGEHGVTRQILKKLDLTRLSSQFSP
jgi:hypothetical protein